MNGLKANFNRNVFASHNWSQFIHKFIVHTSIAETAFKYETLPRSAIIFQSLNDKYGDLQSN